jgi:hypothetical protein
LRYVYSEPLQRDVSVVGFGCASLGSRIAAADGLRALGAAHERGITWYDVAPAYGEGNAEAILGSFLVARREEVVVCTKVGIAPGGGKSRLSWVKPMARAVVNAAPALRGVVRAARPGNQKLAITPQLIEQSVAESLRRLRTDYIDVIALHDAEPEECAQESIIAALSGIIQSGRARTVSIASRAESVISGAAAWTGYGIAQVPGSLLTADIDLLDAELGRPLFRVVHGAFGVNGVLAALKARLHKPEARLRLAGLGYSGSIEEIATSALTDCVFDRNRSGVVLCSMFNPNHLAANCSHANRSPNPGALAAVRAVLELAP